MRGKVGKEEVVRGEGGLGRVRGNKGYRWPQVVGVISIDCVLHIKKVLISLGINSKYSRPLEREKLTSSMDSR